MTVTNYARSSCQILEDATFAACFMFDSGFELIDLGPNGLTSVTSSTSFVFPGHSQQAISLSGASTSYFQVSSLTGLGISNQSFSISLWIQPRSLSGIVVDVSSNAAANLWCFPFIGFATNGAIIAQTLSGTTVNSVFDPSVSPTLVWTHVVQTWSTTHGLRLYVNNALVASNSLASTYTASGVPDYVTLGNGLSAASGCYKGILGSTSPYNGDIDDFRIYSRELTSSEVNTLYYM